MKFVPLFLTVVLISCSIPKEQEHYGSCGLIYHGNYQQILLDSYESINPGVRTKLELHLKEHLGSTLLKDLEFTEVYYTNYKELIHLNPSAKDYQWEVPTYEVFYNFRNDELQLENFAACISLDSLGNVIREITLPSPKVNKNAHQFADIEELKRIATSEGYPIEKYQFDYFDNRLVIKFFDVKQGEHWKELKVCAHTGEVISKGGKGGIVDWY